MKSSIIAFGFLLISAVRSSSQNADIEWSKIYGGSSWDYATIIQSTVDSGYLLVGLTQSNDGDVSFHYGNYDLWIIKLDKNGELEWERAYGGSDGDQFLSIKPTEDFGFICAGSTESSDGDVSFNHGETDAWVVKLDSLGNIEWERSYGGSLTDGAQDIIVLPNDEYLFIGFAYSIDDDLLNNTHYGFNDVWLVRLDAEGNIVSSETYGGSGGDSGISIDFSKDGGFIIAATSTEGDGQVGSSYHGGGGDYWVFKIDSIGSIEWSKCFGGSSFEAPEGVLTAVGNGYYITGDSRSSDGDVTGHHGGSIEDYWIVRIDNNGNLLWEKSFGGTEYDYLFSSYRTNDFGFLLVGTTTSDDGDVTFNHSPVFYGDAWIVKIDSSGNLQWQYCYGGSQGDGASSIVQSEDGSYVFAGSSESSDFDVSMNKGSLDYWIVKLSATTSVFDQNPGMDFSVFPNPANEVLYFKANPTPLEVQVKNMLGETLYTFQATSNTESKIDVSALPNGVYFLVVSHNANKFAQTLQFCVLRF